MCGICGIAIPNRLNRRVNESQLVAMRDSLTHRGPDDAGLLVGRLDRTRSPPISRSLIWAVDTSRWPMKTAPSGSSSTARSTTTANCARCCEERGHLYRSSSDTETIIHLYEEFGPRGVEKLRGMFAYAIWDAAQRRLVIARDRLGIKPLYYALKDDGTLYFASEIKALIEARAIRPELNYNALADYAANRYTSGEETLFHGVKRLLARPHDWSGATARSRSSVTGMFSFTKPEEALTEAQYVERFSELFRECVESHLMADVPLGMFLSGGIDSSAIAAVMSRLVKEPVKTFSVAFDERDANELEYARAGGASLQDRSSRDRRQPRTVLRPSARARLSGRRTPRASVERAALFRLRPGRQARQGRADGRRLG